MHVLIDYLRHDFRKKQCFVLFEDLKKWTIHVLELLLRFLLHHFLCVMGS